MVKRDDEFAFLLYDGQNGVTMLVPNNFYELPQVERLERYIVPALKQLANEHL